MTATEHDQKLALTQLQQNIYDHLTSWQRTQILSDIGMALGVANVAADAGVEYFWASFRMFRRFDSTRIDRLPWRTRSVIVSLIDAYMDKYMAAQRTPPSTGGPDAVSDQCIICYSAPRDILLQPCNHLCVCRHCSRSLKVCPMCRAYICSTTIVFKS